MPWKPKRPCRHPGCKNLSDQAYCEVHRQAIRTGAARTYNQNSRDTELQRFYNSAPWRALRKIKLQRNPMCEICYADGRLTKAAIVDHIKPVKDCYEDRFDIDNLQSVCLSCHSRKTRQEEAARREAETTDKEWKF
jgi:5-methylcytosine-specific restriction protein A